MEELADVLEPIQRWSLASDNAQGVKRAKTYIAGADKDVLAGFYVSSINEWRVKQPRVLVLSRSAYYRVSYNAKNGKIDHYHKTPLEKLRVLEKTSAGLNTVHSTAVVVLTSNDFYNSRSAAYLQRARYDSVHRLTADTKLTLRPQLTTPS